LSSSASGKVHRQD
jgi:hypothetical protein